MSTAYYNENIKIHKLRLILGWRKRKKFPQFIKERNAYAECLNFHAHSTFTEGRSFFTSNYIITVVSSVAYVNEFTQRVEAIFGKKPTVLV